VGARTNREERRFHVVHYECPERCESSRIGAIHGDLDGGSYMTLLDGSHPTSFTEVADRPIRRWSGSVGGISSA